ncbi:MAG: LexA family transcriptional regulator [Acidobacteriia bacterium]|nr:LexA family transcriptional regulator [Terriglobia bacterium]
MAQDKDLPDWARKIFDLRKRLGLSQTALGSRLHYSPMAVSRWETGKHEPTAQCYIQLGNLADDRYCWDFGARAGLQRSDLAQMFPSAQPDSQAKKLLDFDIVHAGGAATREGRKKALRPKLVAIPLLDIHVGTLGQEGGPFTDLTSASVKQVIAAPAMWCPNPDHTNSLRVKGTSMSPYIDDGDIVVVDAAQTDPHELNGKIVVARHRKTDLVMARFISTDGIHILESESHEFAPVPVDRDRK